MTAPDITTPDALLRARLMARIAAPLLSATLQNHDDAKSNPDLLAERFSQDIHRVVPLAQILVDALKPQNDEEHAGVNALTAPIAARLVAQNQDLLGIEDVAEFTRLLKPSVNVLASFCDRESAAAQTSDLQSPLARGLVALSPIIGTLSHYAYGKSPAKRLTDTLDTYIRIRADVLAALPPALCKDPDMQVAVHDAAAQLFTAIFANAPREEGDPNAQFQSLLAQWGEALSMLGVLMSHAVMNESASTASKPKKKEPLRARPPTANDTAEDEDEEEGTVQGSSGSGSHGHKPGNFKPMSFFSKKGA